jgi:predicted AAA+ superfamily ATPase
LNFEKKPEFKKVFAANDVHKIITQLEVLFNCRMITGETLIFLDEIQSCPEVLASLRWFAEDMPDLHIIAAGSLLEGLFD